MQASTWDFGRQFYSEENKVVHSRSVGVRYVERNYMRDKSKNKAFLPQLQIDFVASRLMEVTSM